MVALLHLILISLYSCFSLCTCSCNFIKVTNKNPQSIKGMFVFGSSLVDSGNNNFIQNSMAKANYLPYGVDFPQGPSGRFTNGKTIVDILGESLRLPSFIPAFSDPSNDNNGSRIVHGVNFASAASGILDHTGSIAGTVVSLRQQIKNFEEKSLLQLEAKLGCKRKELLRHYMFVIQSGSNDYSFNYFLTTHNRNRTLQAFTQKLIVSLAHKIKKLYNLGARKFVMIGINPIGCSPMVTMVGTGKDMKRCVEELNEAARLFNTKLKSLVGVMKQQMPGSHLVFVNSYNIIINIITHPSSKGFVEASRPCCDVGTLKEGGNNGVLCKRGGQVCGDRNTHVFFDGLHPTEAVNIQIAHKAYHSNHNAEVFPINIQQLVVNPI